MSTTDTPRTPEIPADWATCVIACDMDELTAFLPTAGKAVLHNFNAGEARIERSEVEDVEQFQAQVLEFQRGQQIVEVEWLNQAESERDKQAESASLERYRKYMEETFGTGSPSQTDKD